MKTSLRYTLPIFNLNGTNPESIYDEFNEALQNLRKSRESLSQCTVHGRDFQCNPIGDYDKARDRHYSMLSLLDEAMDYCEAWLERAQEAIDR